MNNKKKIEESIIYFFSGKKEYVSLSNFYKMDIIIEDRIYQSGEHAFHGEKYIQLSEKCEKIERKNKLFEYGKTFMKPSSYEDAKEAKKKGGKKGLLLYEDELKIWNVISIDVQKKICKYKFDHNELIKDDLIKSKNKILIHPALRCKEEKIIELIWQGKAIIGDDNKLIILGGNQLGNCWMELRKQFEMI
jgi:predicted NAD-dependent protein-ADP-ribosyltransferase YbiA (DUF1768 family)